MRSWRESLYQVGLGLGGSLFVYQMWTAYQSIGLEPIQLVFPLLLAGAVVVGTAVNLMQFGTWVYLMSRLGVSIPWRQAVKGYALSMLARYIPGRIWGYLSRSQWLYQSHGVPYGVSNAASVLEVLGLIVAGGVIVAWYGGKGTSSALQWGLFSLLFFLPFGVWLIMHESLKQPLVRRLSPGGLGAICALRITLCRWLIAVTIYLIIWMCLGGSILLVVHALDLSPRGGVGEATFAFVAAWIVGSLFVFVPAGLGIRELVLSSLMTSTLGIASNSATVVSVVIRFASLVAEAIYLLGVMLIGIIGPLDR